MKNFLSVDDVTDPQKLVKEALSLKENPFAHETLGRQKTLALLFFNPSLRTRLSTQKAAQHLGMNIMVMNVSKDGWQIEFENGAIMSEGKQEHIREAAAVISQYCDIMGIRTFPTLTDREQDYQEAVMAKFVQYASVPIVSLESATRHPLQSLADCMTIEQQKTKAKPKVVLTWAPHPKPLPQAVANSFSEWMRHAEVDFVVTHPKGYELSDSFVKETPIIYDQEAAFEGADFIYAKNWSSYQEYGQILDIQEDWMISEEKMAVTNQAKFMHCLPVRRNVVVADQVLDSPQSMVIEQANNRTFAAQAVLKAILESH